MIGGAVARLAQFVEPLTCKQDLRVRVLHQAHFSYLVCFSIKICSGKKHKKNNNKNNTKKKKKQQKKNKGTYKHRIGPVRAQLPDRTRFSVLWSFFLRYFILYAQLEEVYSIQNYFYLTPSFQYKKNGLNITPPIYIYIAKRLM